ncbi:MAG: acyl-CoA dehydrogenase family protein [Solirubrobacterales bacterium]
MDAALREIEAGAAVLDREPRFPAEAFELLHAEGATAATLPGVDGRRPGLEAEWRLVRTVAEADGSVGRILDGHLNAVDRLLGAGDTLATETITRVREGDLFGLWGADPGAGEGAPAALSGPADRPVLNGAKTFCSGAGGVDAALVMARGREPGPPALVLVDIDDSVDVDRDWYRGGGLRASESHLVRFDATPVRAVIGEPGELGREPSFSLDAMRTTASWAGMSDRAAGAALADLAERRADDPLAQLAAGRIAASRETIDAWFGHALSRTADGEDDLRAVSVRLRAEVAGAATRILDEAARACGSHPFATGRALDRARRDLELFTLQHRLDPLLARDGRVLLAAGENA